jgi:TolB-like protein
MEERRLEPPPIRFGPFEFKPASLELFRHGVRVRVPVQPLRVLSVLLARPGVLVTREELRAELWPDGTFVDFEHGLNAAVRRLRRGLRDSARSPRFIQTLARRGYRFMAHPSRTVEEARGRIDCTVAVLPFQNLDGDIEIEYLADGIAESLIGRLSRISRIRVMARSATFRYKGRQSDPQTAGRRLNADYVVVGTVTSRPNLLSVHAELVDVAGGWQLWSRTYRAPIASAGTIDEALAQAIVGRLGLSLSDGESLHLKKRQTLNADARRHYFERAVLLESDERDRDPPCCRTLRTRDRNG